MKVFLAGETPLSKIESWKREGIDIDAEKLETIIKRRLFSYFYHNDSGGILDKEIRESIRLKHELFLDSGAYSAFTKGKPVNLKDYGEFMLRQGHHFKYQANLDDIGDDGTISWDNMKKLEKMGCKPFPVFHYGDKPEYLLRMLDEGYPFLALGGLVGASNKVLQVWLDHVWGTYLTNPDGTAKTRVHGFGLTSQELMFRYPWYSVDSSSWVMKSIYGMCALIINGQFMSIFFSDESPTSRDANGWHYKTMPPPLKRAIEEKLEPYKITPEQLAGHYAFRHIINSATYQGLEDLPHTDKFILEQPTLF